MASFAFVTNAKDGAVATFRVDPDAQHADALLTRVAVSEVGPGCSTLAVDPARRRVYVGVKAAGDSPDDAPAAIVTADVEADGSLTVVGRREVPDAVHYLALTRDGATLVAASYGGGFGVSLPVTDDGVGEIVSRIDHPNMHSCAVTADGRTAYFVSLGADLVAQCRLDGATMTPMDPPTVSAPQGCGPRHLTLNAAEDRLYVLTEFSGEVLRYDRDEQGALTYVAATPAYAPDRGLKHSRYGADPREEHLIWGADLHFSADERVLWASERTESTLATLPVSEDGAVGEPVQFVETEKQPRGFCPTPDGGYLLCTGELTTTVSLFAVDPDAHTLTQVAQSETGNGANWVRYLPADV